MSRVTPDNPRARFAEQSRRATIRAALKANRRRALPRWTGPAVKAAAVLLPLLGLGGTGAWAWHTGRIQTGWAETSATVLSVTAEAGWAVQEVFVTGRIEADPQTLLDALKVERGMPILAFDPHAARTALEQIPWVASATVERRMPDTIHVRIVERTPMAIWQVDRRHRLVDGNGVVLTEANLEKWPDLPLLVGENAPTQAKELLETLSAEPLIGTRVEAAVLVGGRRWDLRLDNGIDVRLPEEGMADALRQLSVVQQTNQVLERDVVVVDLRVPDRLVVQTSAEAAEARRKAAAEKKRRI
ncbi:MAG: cell division protein FtsQ [Pseudomonadota bacterium]|jgi:cell division protein FtsQ